MAMPQTNKPLKSVLLLSVLLLTACASNLPTQLPEPTREIQLTPLPASVRSIASKNSATWLEKERAYCKKLENFSGSETETSSACGTN